MPTIWDILTTPHPLTNPELWKMLLGIKEPPEYEEDPHDNYGRVDGRNSRDPSERVPYEDSVARGLAWRVAEGELDRQDAQDYMDTRALAQYDPSQGGDPGILASRLRARQREWDARDPAERMGARPTESARDAAIREHSLPMTTPEGEVLEGPRERLRGRDVPGDAPGEFRLFGAPGAAISGRQLDDNIDLAEYVAKNMVQPYNEGVASAVKRTQQNNTTIERELNAGLISPEEAHKRQRANADEGGQEIERLDRQGAEVKRAASALMTTPSKAQKTQQAAAQDVALAAAFPTAPMLGMVAGHHLLGGEYSERMPSRVPILAEPLVGALDTILRSNPEMRRFREILGVDSNGKPIKGRHDLLANAQEAIEVDDARENEDWVTKTTRRSARAIGEIADLYMLAKVGPTQIAQENRIFKKLTARTREADLLNASAKTLDKAAAAARRRGRLAEAQRKSAEAITARAGAIALLRDENILRQYAARMGPAFEDMFFTEMGTGSTPQESIVGAALLTTATGAAAVHSARLGHGILKGAALTGAATFAQEFSRLAVTQGPRGMPLEEILSQSLATAIGMTVGSKFSDAAFSPGARQAATETFHAIREQRSLAGAQKYLDGRLLGDSDAPLPPDPTVQRLDIGLATDLPGITSGSHALEAGLALLHKMDADPDLRENLITGAESLELDAAVWAAIGDDGINTVADVERVLEAIQTSVTSGRRGIREKERGESAGLTLQLELLIASPRVPAQAKAVLRRISDELGAVVPAFEKASHTRGIGTTGPQKDHDSRYSGARARRELMNLAHGVIEASGDRAPKYRELGAAMHREFTEGVPPPETEGETVTYELVGERVELADGTIARMMGTGRDGRPLVQINGQVVAVDPSEVSPAPPPPFAREAAVPPPFDEDQLHDSENRMFVPGELSEAPFHFPKLRPRDMTPDPVVTEASREAIEAAVRRHLTRAQFSAQVPAEVASARAAERTAILADLRTKRDATKPGSAERKEITRQMAWAYVLYDPHEAEVLAEVERLVDAAAKYLSSFPTDDAQYSGPHGPWMPIVVNGVTATPKKPPQFRLKATRRTDKVTGESVMVPAGWDLELTWKKVPYGLQLPLDAEERRAAANRSPKGPDKVAERQRIWDRQVDQLSDAIVDNYLQLGGRAEAGDTSARFIMGHEGWYSGLIGELRNRFGGNAELLADLLGAFSPQNPVNQNWKDALDVLERFSTGEFDHEMLEFATWMSESRKTSEKLGTGHGARGFPSKYRITKVNKVLYGLNSINGMMALYDIWRIIRPGVAAKARNFGGNTIGLTNRATIDVWMARYLRRLLGEIHKVDGVVPREYRRIPPAAEGSVTGTYVDANDDWRGMSIDASGTDLEFGMGQDAFEATVAKLKAQGIEVDPMDLQAVMWFAEKEVWSNNSWTNKTGGEGDLIKEVTESGLVGWTMAFTPATAGKVPPEIMLQAAHEWQNFFEGNDKIRIFRVEPTIGVYAGDPEDSLDIEFTTTKDFDPGELTSFLAEMGAKYHQKDTFVSRRMTIGEENANARPGVEIMFRNPTGYIPQPAAKPVTPPPPARVMRSVLPPNLNTRVLPIAENTNPEKTLHTLTHWSKERRDVIEGGHHGTGMKGMESRRRDNPNFISTRVYLYSAGELPERDVGWVPHTVRVEASVYDLDNDPLGVLEETRSLIEADPSSGELDLLNETETRLLDMGYDGIRYMNGKAVVMLNSSLQTDPQPAPSLVTVAGAEPSGRLTDRQASDAIAGEPQKILRQAAADALQDHPDVEVKAASDAVRTIGGGHENGLTMHVTGAPVAVESYAASLFLRLGQPEVTLARAPKPGEAEKILIDVFLGDRFVTPAAATALLAELGVGDGTTVALAAGPGGRASSIDVIADRNFRVHNLPQMGANMSLLVDSDRAHEVARQIHRRGYKMNASRVAASTVNRASAEAAVGAYHAGSREGEADARIKRWDKTGADARGRHEAAIGKIVDAEGPGDTGEATGRARGEPSADGGDPIGSVQHPPTRPAIPFRPRSVHKGLETVPSEIVGTPGMPVPNVAQEIFDRLREAELDGYTFSVDPRTVLTHGEFGHAPENYTGIRLQFVPEFHLRAEQQDWIDKTNPHAVALVQQLLSGDANQIDQAMAAPLRALVDALSEISALDEVADVRVWQYDTLVIPQEEYGNYSEANRANHLASGGRWFGQPVSEHVAAAVGYLGIEPERVDDGTGEEGALGRITAESAERATGAPDPGPSLGQRALDLETKIDVEEGGGGNMPPTGRPMMSGDKGDQRWSSWWRLNSMEWVGPLHRDMSLFEAQNAIRQADVEFVFSYDPKTNRIVHRATSNEKESCSYPREFARTSSERGLWTIHNHPIMGYVSAADFSSQAFENSPKGIVLLPDGRNYVIDAPDGWGMLAGVMKNGQYVEQSALVHAFNAAMEDAFERGVDAMIDARDAGSYLEIYANAVDGGDLHPDGHDDAGQPANREHFDEWMKENHYELLEARVIDEYRKVLSTWRKRKIIPPVKLYRSSTRAIFGDRGLVKAGANIGGRLDEGSGGVEPTGRGGGEGGDPGGTTPTTGEGKHLVKKSAGAGPRPKPGPRAPSQKINPLSSPNRVYLPRPSTAVRVDEASRIRTFLQNVADGKPNIFDGEKIDLDSTEFKKIVEEYLYEHARSDTSIFKEKTGHRGFTNAQYRSTAKTIAKDLVTDTSKTEKSQAAQAKRALDKFERILDRVAEAEAKAMLKSTVGTPKPRHKTEAKRAADREAREERRQLEADRGETGEETALDRESVARIYQRTTNVHRVLKHMSGRFAFGDHPGYSGRERAGLRTVVDNMRGVGREELDLIMGDMLVIDADGYVTKIKMPDGSTVNIPPRNKLTATHVKSAVTSRTFLEKPGRLENEWARITRESANAVAQVVRRRYYPGLGGTAQLAKFLRENNEYEGGLPYFDSKELDRLAAIDGLSTHEVSIDDLSIANDAVLRAVHLWKEETALANKDSAADLEATVQAGVAAITSQRGEIPRVDEDLLGAGRHPGGKGPARIPRNLLERYTRGTGLPEDFVHRLFNVSPERGRVPRGEAHVDIAYNNVMDGYRAFLGNILDSHTALDDQLKSMGFLRGVDDPKLPFSAPGRFRLVRIGQSEVRMTAGERMSLWLKLRDPRTWNDAMTQKVGFDLRSDSVKRHIRGEDLTPEVANELLQQMSEDETQLAEWMYTYINTTERTDELRAVHEVIDGTPGNFPDGGVWLRPRNLSARPKGPRVQSMEAFPGSTIIETGSRFQARTSSGLPILIGDAFAEFDEMVRAQAALLHMAVPIREGRRLMQHPMMRDAMRLHVGEDPAKYMDSFYEHMSKVATQQQSLSASGAGAIADSARLVADSYFYLKALGLNFKVMAYQPQSYYQYAAQIDEKYLVKAAIRTGLMNPPRLAIEHRLSQRDGGDPNHWLNAAHKSPLLSWRRRNDPRAVAAGAFFHETAFRGERSLNEKAKGWMMAGISFMDWCTISTAHLAAKYQTEAEFRAAGKRVDTPEFVAAWHELSETATRRTQTNPLAIDASSLTKQMKERDWLRYTFGLFRGPLNAAWASLQRETQALAAKKSDTTTYLRRGVAPFVAQMVGVAIVNGAFGVVLKREVLSKMVPRPDDEEDEEYREAFKAQAKWETLENMIATAPVIGTIVSMIMGWIKNGAVKPGEVGDMITIPPIDLASNATKAAWSFYKSFWDPDQKQLRKEIYGGLDTAEQDWDQAESAVKLMASIIPQVPLQAVRTTRTVRSWTMNAPEDSAEKYLTDMGREPWSLKSKASKNFATLREIKRVEGQISDGEIDLSSPDSIDQMEYLQLFGELYPGHRVDQVTADMMSDRLKSALEALRRQKEHGNIDLKLPKEYQ